MLGAITGIGTPITADIWEGAIFVTDTNGALEEEDKGISFLGTYGGASASYTSISTSYVRATSD